MSIYILQVNGEEHEVNVDPDMPLLWLLRDVMGLVGTKYGCGIGQCGACTVHLGGIAVRSCLVRVSDVSSKPIKTIEGLADGIKLHPLQEEWIEQDVAQCGYCQAGQIMSAAALLEQNSSPSEDEIESAMAGNYCRCGTYNRIVSAVKSASEKMSVSYFDPKTEGQAHETSENLAKIKTRKYPDRSASKARPALFYQTFGSGERRFCDRCSDTGFSV